MRRGVVRLEVEPIFCWVRLKRDEQDHLDARDPGLKKDIQDGRKIRLARVEIKECRIKSLSVKERRQARPNTRPYIACGRAPWIFDKKNPSQSCVDTTCGGFAAEPCYTARLEGLAEPGEQSRLAGWRVQLLATLFFGIRNPRPDGFEVSLDVANVLKMSGQSADQVNTDLFRAVVGSSEIVWMGVE